MLIHRHVLKYVSISTPLKSISYDGFIKKISSSYSFFVSLFSRTNICLRRFVSFRKFRYILFTHIYSVSFCTFVSYVTPFRPHVNIIHTRSFTFVINQLSNSHLLFPVLRESFTKDHSAELRDVVPKIPIIKTKAANQKKDSAISKALIPTSIFSGRHSIEPQTISRKTTTDDKLLSKDIFSPQQNQNVAPDIAITSLRDKVDKSLLMDFPKSPFVSKPKETIMGARRMSIASNNHEGGMMSFNSKLYDTAVNSNLYPQSAPLAYSWRQYIPFGAGLAPVAPVIGPAAAPVVNYGNYQNGLMQNDQASSLTASVGAARYAIARNPPVLATSGVGKPLPAGKPAAAAIHPKSTNPSGTGNPTGADYPITLVKSNTIPGRLFHWTLLDYTRTYFK